MKASARPRKLSPEAQAALVLVAVLGGRVRLPALGALGVPAEVLDELFDAAMLVPDEATHTRLADAVTSEAVLAPVPWSERRRIHERVAAYLASQPDSVHEAARHYLAACRYAEARRFFVRYAETACHERRYPEALGALDEALRIWPADEEPEARLRIVREMVRCARNSGRHDVAARALREMLEMPALQADPQGAISVHQQLADLALLEVDFGSARRHLEAAAHLAEKAGPAEDAARCWFALASFLADQVRTKDAQEAIGRALKLAGPKCDPALRSEMLGFEGLIFAMLGDAKRARTRVEEALALAIEHKLKREAAIAYRRRANIREYCSDYTGERDAHLHAISLCRKHAKDSEQTCLVCLSYVFFRTGEWKRALEIARKVSSETKVHPAFKAGALGVRAMVAAFRGEQRQTVALLAEAGLGLRRHGVLSLEFHLLWAQGFSHEAAGELDGAASIYGRLLDLWDDTNDVHDVVPGAMTAAAFFADRGDGKRLAQAMDILHAVVAANDNEENRSARAAILGECAASKGDLSGAVAHFSVARDGYDRLGTPIERALVRRRLARVLVAAGREREAVEEREACAAIARELGMRPVLASLTHSGAAAPKANAGEALTGRQRDVLELLAAGLTNKEAADRLHLSPRTVEMHVASLLDRLNCRTRSEAIGKAGALGLLK